MPVSDSTSALQVPSRDVAGVPRPFATFWLHALIELQVFWRSPVQMGFIAVLPVVFYLIFGLSFRDRAQEVRDVGDHTLTQGNLSFAGVLAFALLSVALANVAIGLAIRRHAGIYRRLRTTPVGPATVMGAYLFNSLLTSAILSAVIVALGVGALGVDTTAIHVGQLVGALALGFVCIAPVGAAVSLIPPSAEAAVPIVNAIFFPMAFLSGTFFQVPLADTVQSILDLLPGVPLMTLMTGAVAADGPVWDTRSMVVLLAWAVVTTGVALRFFRWSSETEVRTPRARRRTR